MAGLESQRKYAKKEKVVALTAVSFGVSTQV